MLKSAIIGLGNAGFLYDHKTKNEILTHTKAYNYSVNTNLECVSEIDDKKTLLLPVISIFFQKR